MAGKIMNNDYGKSIYLKERLPPLERAIKQKTDDLGLITSTQKSDDKQS